MFCSFRLCASALAVLFVINTSNLFAGGRDPSVPSLLAHDAARTTSAGAVDVSTGFEMPQFQSGFSIVGQAGWTCSPEAIVSSFVSSFNPDTGDQHVRLIDNPGVPSSLRSFVVSPIFAPLAQAN